MFYLSANKTLRKYVIFLKQQSSFAQINSKCAIFHLNKVEEQENFNIISQQCIKKSPFFAKITILHKKCTPECAFFI